MSQFRPSKPRDPDYEADFNQLSKKDTALDSRLTALEKKVNATTPTTNATAKTTTSGGSGGSGGTGPAGPTGPPGPPGSPGAAATISVGSVATGAAGSPATVANSGTSSAAVFDFSIPQGDQGDPGDDGNDGANGAISLVQDNGTPLPVQPFLNFIGATITDNPGNTSTDVDVTGGGGGTITVYDDPPADSIGGSVPSSITYSSISGVRLGGGINVIASSVGTVSVQRARPVISTVTGSLTLTAHDAADEILIVTAACTVTMPTALSGAADSFSGKLYHIYNEIGIGGTVTVAGLTNLTTTETLTQRYACLVVQAVGSGSGGTWRVISKYLA